MSKTSDWVIVATEGNTVDGRKITASWINDMAQLYSTDEYTAMIWPEHRRVYGYGDNWGTVEALKAEKKDGQLRLFAKLTPNQYLLYANKNQQKLFTSIEPEPDYKGNGRCYLMGLAVTDSPASTGTTRLKFSRKPGTEITLESDAFEEIDFSGCFTRSDIFFSMCKTFFSGEQPEPANSQTEDEQPMNTEQFNQMMGAINTIGTKQGELEEKFKQFSQQPDAPETPKEPAATPEPEPADKTTGLTGEQFSQLTEMLNGIASKQGEMENQFKKLAEEAPGQRPDESGSDAAMEVF
ncbi:GPO family capsid scaffolding protein [Vibrio quintilis]|uniref:Phage capsid scaffolding protein (GPO) serine peptidase n=1 Tax=Vibrio quintilis TaxID=1117707 RepID=A0A1M7YZA0_9VIBR|nr:GPO family capsid scaffolding protein [Vibrio quintilis]SHO57882.1 Phage capsid scaffolding protein (GPO) serine peptidase [Vibrio quintilis]